MREILRLGRGALLLDTQTFMELRASKDVFKKGVTLIVAISLVVGIVGSAVDFIGEVTAPPPEVGFQKMRQGINQALDMMQSFGGPSLDPKMREMIQSYMEAGFGIASRIAEIPTPLPSPARETFKAVGGAISSPFRRMFAWMFYGLLVLVVAKVLGGKATIQQMLGCTSLYVVPHILDAFGFVPCLGALLSLIAFFWGIVIYVKGVAVAHDFGYGKAILAFLLPLLGPIFLLLLLAIFVIALVAR